MQLTSINKKNFDPDRIALFDLGFRGFFLSAAVFSILSILFWTAIYVFHFSVDTLPLTSFQWHSHEMIYGYSMAVIAGFLLTAIMNWTGIQTVHGRNLVILVSFWLIARILLLFGSRFFFLAGTFDLIFGIYLLWNVAFPIIKSKSWKQIGIISKVLLLVIGNLFFYLGALGQFSQGVYISIYGGLYIIISLILTIGSRVIPNFIKNASKQDITIHNPKWIVIISLLLMVLLLGNELFFQIKNLSGYFTLLLFMANSVRLYHWYSPVIWKNPLLWSLYLSFTFINLGFLLFTLSEFMPISKFLAIHSFTYGGIGLATLSMMCRVTLGHTGRRVTNVSSLNTYMFMILCLGGIIRVLFPVILSDYYILWIFCSQILWLAAFLLFIFIYGNMLIKSGIDGK